MYTFNKNSWLYRLANLIGSPAYVTNQCPYVRMVAGGLLLFSIITLIAGAFVLGNILTILSAFQGVFWAVEGGTWFNAVSVVTVVVLGCMLFNEAKDRVHLYLYYRNRKKKSIHAEVAPRKPEPSLIVVWLKSVHDKVCPQINFKE